MNARAGFVLVGGNSSRMGQDKASLPFRGKTLVEHVASAVTEAAGSVTLVGAPDRYRNLGFPILPDSRPGAGPLARIDTARRVFSPRQMTRLAVSDLEWLRDAWKSGGILMNQHSKLNDAFQAFDASGSLPSRSVATLAIWGALKNISFPGEAGIAIPGFSEHRLVLRTSRVGSVGTTPQADEAA